jgi:hypothetical protein
MKFIATRFLFFFITTLIFIKTALAINMTIHHCGASQWGHVTITQYQDAGPRKLIDSLGKGDNQTITCGTSDGCYLYIFGNKTWNQAKSRRGSQANNQLSVGGSNLYLKRKNNKTCWSTSTQCQYLTC